METLRLKNLIKTLKNQIKFNRIITTNTTRQDSFLNQKMTTNLLIILEKKKVITKNHTHRLEISPKMLISTQNIMNKISMANIKSLLKANLLIN